VRLKANGAVRIIMNMSYPHEPKMGEGVACSPNAGMKDYEEFEPCTMTSDYFFRKAL
jgi:hypothetical protein